MADNALIPVLSYLGWSFLPNLATQFLQTIYYRITLSAGTPHPQPGSPLYARDHRRIRICVLTLYLLYTLAQSLYDVKLAGDFYTLLGVDPYLTTEKEIKSKVRRLAARYHPDKLGASSSSTSDDDQSSIFVKLRLASETLTTPSHKYAYTHFGPGVVTHIPKPDETTATSNSSAKQITRQTAELVTLALRRKIPSYLGTLTFIAVLNSFLLPKKAPGKFWRYLILSSSFVLEVYLITHDVPALPGGVEQVLGWLRGYTKLGDLLPGHLLPYQLLEISGRFAMSLNIFISQIGVLFPGASGVAGGDTAQLKAWMTGLNTSLGSLASVSGRIDGEAGGLLALQFAPFRGDWGRVGELRRGMKEGMVMGAVRGHGEVREAVRRVVERRREAGRGRGGVKVGRGDGADVVDLLRSDEQFV
ncbi:hypothetical protein PMZ80_002891 [Knufia obscura]|uniref:J domain-containing protein n=2 Tax=Knufia TaxID=430999 RepID=A0AAN8I7S4_9EURO|nr:hypothetical protein PMZ80_002891 [Knufia obscura]KAK5952520.1 hypothetical protein OHC33_006564 [Knufia fluminis]